MAGDLSSRHFGWRRASLRGHANENTGRKISSPGRPLISCFADCFPRPSLRELPASCNKLARPPGPHEIGPWKVLLVLIEKSPTHLARPLALMAMSGDGARTRHSPLAPVEVPPSAATKKPARSPAHAPVPLI